MELKTFFAQDAQGNILPTPTAYLYLPGTTTLASGLQDASGSPLSNPFTGDANGRIQLAAPDGDYDLRVVKAKRDYTMRVRFIDVAEQLAEAQGIVDDLKTVWYGDLPADPEVDPLGNPPKAGASYYNTTLKQTRIFDGAEWGAQIDPTDASAVAFQQAGSDAVARTAQDKLREFVSVKDFGAVGDGVTDDTAAIQKAIDEAASIGGTVLIHGTCLVSETILVAGNVSIDCANGKLVAADGFAEEEPIIQFGDTTNPNAAIGVWRGSCNSLRIDCAGQRVIGAEFSRTAGDADVVNLIVDNHNFIGVNVTGGWGLNIHSYRINAISLNGPYAENAGTDTIGLLVASTDSTYGHGDIFGSFVGIKATGGNNVFVGAHPFGLYVKDGIPQSCPMGVCVWNEGQANSFIGCIADSPSMIDFDEDASLTNGGYGFVNRVNGFQAKFIGCNVLIPNRGPFGEVAPISKLIAYLANQSSSYFGCEVEDQVGAVLTRYSGSNINTCAVISLQEIRLYSFAQPIWGRKPFFNKGIEFLAKYQDSNERTETWGACAFNLPSVNWFEIVSNYDGDKRTTRIERYRNGDSTMQSTLAGRLGPGDKGYTFYNETDGKLRVWDGTQFKLPDGTVG